MYARPAAFFLFCSVLAHGAEIRGKVVSVVGGEALARVQVEVLETGAQAVTASDGNFALKNLCRKVHSPSERCWIPPRDRAFLAGVGRGG